MMLTFKVIGTLISYPSAELQAHMNELIQVINGEKMLKGREAGKLIEFMIELADRDIIDVQADYVATFDRSRGNSLYLFEHIHGESRDRGQAMVDLIDHYRSKGLELSARELPDYLPLFLEFLSRCDQEESQELLGEVVQIVAGVGAKLKAKNSPWAAPFRALEKMTDAKIDPEYIRHVVAEEEARDESLEALDKEWEDTPAFDGLGVDDCGVCPSAVPIKPTVGQHINHQEA